MGTSVHAALCFRSKAPPRDPSSDAYAMSEEERIQLPSQWQKGKYKSPSTDSTSRIGAAERVLGGVPCDGEPYPLGSGSDCFGTDSEKGSAQESEMERDAGSSTECEAESEPRCVRAHDRECGTQCVTESETGYATVGQTDRESKRECDAETDTEYDTECQTERGSEQGCGPGWEAAEPLEPLFRDDSGIAMHTEIDASIRSEQNRFSWRQLQGQALRLGQSGVSLGQAHKQYARTLCREESGARVAQADRQSLARGESGGSLGEGGTLPLFRDDSSVSLGSTLSLSSRRAIETFLSSLAPLDSGPPLRRGTKGVPEGGLTRGPKDPLHPLERAALGRSPELPEEVDWNQGHFSASDPCQRDLRDPYASLGRAALGPGTECFLSEVVREACRDQERGYALTSQDSLAGDLYPSSQGACGAQERALDCEFDTQGAVRGGMYSPGRDVFGLEERALVCALTPQGSLVSDLYPSSRDEDTKGKEGEARGHRRFATVPPKRSRFIPASTSSAAIGHSASVDNRSGRTTTNTSRTSSSRACSPSTLRALRGSLTDSSPGPSVNFPSSSALLPMGGLGATPRGGPETPPTAGTVPMCATSTKHQAPSDSNLEAVVTRKSFSSVNSAYVGGEDERGEGPTDAEWLLDRRQESSSGPMLMEPTETPVLSHHGTPWDVDIAEDVSEGKVGREGAMDVPREEMDSVTVPNIVQGRKASPMQRPHIHIQVLEGIMREHLDFGLHGLSSHGSRRRSISQSPAPAARSAARPRALSERAPHLGSASVGSSPGDEGVNVQRSPFGRSRTEQERVATSRAVYEQERGGPTWAVLEDAGVAMSNGRERESQAGGRPVARRHSFLQLKTQPPEWRPDDGYSGGEE